ncbi:MAG: IS607 family transposase [Candidatus Thorarchaeota archaeon]|nr:MAG: IS607 family transposase [Candidatus Thorarchaeota archaeon]
MLSKLITLSKASELLSVSKWYIRRLSEDVLPVYKTQGGHRRYKESDVKSLIGELAEESNTDAVAIYSRVSSNDQKQKGDLTRQKERLYDYCTKNNYTVIESYEEVGSGMNDKRTKLKKLIKLLSEGKISKVIIEHKDRLTRFNYNMFVLFFEQLGVEVVCVEEILPKSFENELVEDMISLMTSFSAKIYGKRSHKNKKKD